MSKSTEAAGGTSPSDRADKASSEETSQDQPWPSREERLKVIRAYQSKALGRKDPHVANLELLDGDIMLVALSVRRSMDKALLGGTETPESSRRFAQQTEMFFRCAHQISRNAGIIRQLTQPAKEEPGAEL